MTKGCPQENGYEERYYQVRKIIEWDYLEKINLLNLLIKIAHILLVTNF